MPRFNFRVRDGVAHPSPEGLILSDLGEARIAALQITESLFRAHAGESWINDDWQLVVTDDLGGAVFVLQISSITEPHSPATIPRY